MFYSIRVGEEHDSVLLKKERKQNQVKMIRINPFFLRQRSYHFRSNWSYISFQFLPRVLMYFHAPLRPRKMDKFLFLGTHTRFVTTKKRMVTPPLTTSFINFIVIKIHVMSYRDRICNLLSSCIAGKDLTPWKGWFIRIDMRVQLHCIARIHVVYLKQVDRLASLMVQSSSHRAPLLLGPQRKI